MQQVESRVRASAARPADDWRRRYAWQLTITDALVLIWVVVGAQFAWLGLDRTAVGFSGSRDDIAISYTAVSIGIIVMWMCALHVYGSRGFRVAGAGTVEYKLVADATVRVFGVVAIVAFLVKLDLARGYVLISFPLGLAVLIASRWLWRQWLAVKRLDGQFTSTVLLVGTSSSSAVIARELARAPRAGYRVVGACVPIADEAETLSGTSVPIIGTLDSALETMTATGADTLVITGADELTPVRVRELSWGLEPGRQHLVVAPGLVDIGGPRIHTRPVSGLPLLHVETPRFEGSKLYMKRLLDIVVSFVLVVVLAPLFVILAIAIKTTSAGPVFYRQERIGRRGAPFSMLKFRSMQVDADDRLDALLAEQGSTGEPLFKVRNDPRVTRIGATLRRYSLDELPQLFNVLTGTMSLVGPRPQREGEVALYDSTAHRRLLVPPGMTGLWQVSGRSKLAWEDALRLDLYYVENWSLTNDLAILLQTVRVVVRPGDGEVQ
ncbi:sugar transferase [Agromyces atrinae]|uniref:Sugar transferase n=1 Tax=Agromyces atrinae TaxID=592376 RepID=A0A4Q2M2W4_9MICO|nr:sugar transferase [Agromyces atrinae]